MSSRGRSRLASTEPMDPADRASEIQERIEAATKVAAAHAGAGVNRLPHASPICVDCGHGIPAERLAVMPQASRCVDCQGELEQNERRRA